jgi:predicted transcriptional regulator
MSSQLHPKEVELFRCLKKTAILVMLLFRLDKPVGETEIASILDMYPTTVRTYLRSLARLGVVTRTHRHNGWTLTAGGRQMILGQSIDETLASQTGKIKTSVKNARSTVKNARSRVKISRSRYSRGMRINKKGDRTATGSARSDPMVRANLEAFASIGLARNDFVSEICQMDHVTPDYIRGQKKRLEAERRYSHGLLLTVIRSNDYLPEKYPAREEPEPEITENEQEKEEDPKVAQEIEPDPSIYEPISANGMTAAKAWSTVLGQLKVDMRKAAYDKWVRDAVLISYRDGTFVIGVYGAYAREWLSSRLTSTSKRLLIGICSRCVEIKFIDLNDPMP